jgi:hypothetical protein
MTTLERNADTAVVRIDIDNGFIDAFVRRADAVHTT